MITARERGQLEKKRCYEDSSFIALTKLAV